mgnify:CR=1 FL=1
MHRSRGWSEDGCKRGGGVRRWVQQRFEGRAIKGRYQVGNRGQTAQEGGNRLPGWWVECKRWKDRGPQQGGVLRSGVEGRGCAGCRTAALTVRSSDESAVAACRRVASRPTSGRQRSRQRSAATESRHARRQPGRQRCELPADHRRAHHSGRVHTAANATQKATSAARHAAGGRSAGTTAPPVDHSRSPRS